MPEGDPAAGEQIGPYVVEGLIARGGMATVLAVRDARTGVPRAMKLLHPIRMSDEATVRFRREFRILSRLDHPNVLRVFDSGMHGDRAWFAMERVVGRDLRAEVAAWATMAPEQRFARVEEVLIQVARALACVHAHGIIHRDITPGNILVDASGRVRLSDFGVVKEMGGAEYTRAGEVVGTVAYMAPEQFEGRSFDARADLYALGAVLYFMLTGRRPFSATSLRGYLHKHLTEAPMPPREIVGQVPPRLDAVCMRLLEKDPADRYGSATHVLHALGARDDIGARRWPPRAIVGRPVLRARIQEALESAASGRGGGAIVIRGEPGQGKTFLVDLAEQTAAGLGLRVARARCRQHDRPFGALASIYRALYGDHGRGEADLLLRAALMQDSAEIALLGAAPSEPLPPSGEPTVPGMVRTAVPRERYPVFAALKEQIVAMAPVLIALDDLHVADPATAEAVAYLVRNTLELANDSVVFVCSEDARRPSALNRSLPVQRHVLGGLTATDVEELIVSILPDDPGARALAQRLWVESGASPGLLVDMLRALRDDDLVRMVDGQWRLALLPEQVADAPLPLPASLKVALSERLEPLTDDARVVARTLAVARRHVDLDVLVEASALPEAIVMDAIDELEEEGIVVERRIGDRTEVTLYHPRLRDVLLAGLPESVLKEMHLVLGGLLEHARASGQGEPLEELAWHFEQGGDLPKAWGYLAQTAARHVRGSLYEEGLVFIDHALELRSQVRPSLGSIAFDRAVVDLHLQRAAALQALGRSDEASRSCGEALALASVHDDARSMSHAEALLGDLQRGRDAEVAEAHLHRALALADRAGDATLRPMPLYWLGAVRWQRGDVDEPARLWTEALEAAEAVGDERAAAWAHNGLGIVEVCRGRAFEARRQVEMAAEMFERQGMTGPLHVVRYNLVELYYSLGILNKALALSEIAIARAREVSATQGLAVALSARTQVLMTVGRIDEARAVGAECVPLAMQLGDREDELHVRSNLARMAIDLGEPDEALQVLAPLGPPESWADSEGWAARTLARRSEALALLGRNDEAKAILDQGPGVLPPWSYVRVRVDLAWGRALASLGDQAAAEPLLRRALAAAEAGRYRVYALTARRCLVNAPEDGALHRRMLDATARSLAANLGPRDAATFLARWA